MMRQSTRSARLAWCCVALIICIQASPCSGRSGPVQFAVHDVCFTASGDVIMAGSQPNIGGEIRVQSTSTGIGRTINVHNRTVSCAAVLSNGKVLASAGDIWSAPCQLLLTDLLTGERVATLRGHQGGIMAIAISPNDRWMVTGGGSAGEPDAPGELVIWDLQECAPVRVLTGHRGMVMDVAYSPDGTLICTAGRVVHIWDAATGELVQALQGSRGRIRSVAFSPDGSLVATAGGDWGEAGEVRIWNTSDWSLSQTFDCDSWVNAVAFSPDGKTLAFGGGYRNLLGAVDLHAQQIVISRRARSIVMEVHAIAFSHDGQILAIGAQRPEVEIIPAVFRSRIDVANWVVVVAAIAAPLLAVALLILQKRRRRWTSVATA